MGLGFQKPKILLLLALAALLANRVTLADSAVLAPFELQTFKTHSRLAIRLDEGVDTEYHTVKNGFELLLKGVALIDLGAPLGAEEQWARERLKVSDARLESVKARELPQGVLISGVWKFAKGEQAPADRDMEFFEYRQAKPARYILDFWPKGGVSLAKANAHKVASARTQLLKESAEQARKVQERRLAAEKAREERADLGRYCRQPLTEENDVLLPFTPARERVAFEKYLPTTMPDAAFEYRTPPKVVTQPDQLGTPDNQYVRLALELYRKGKYALVLRTFDFFKKEHPTSDYRHEMSFLKANTLIRLGQKEEAEALLQSLIVDARDQSVALHSAMYLAGKQIAAGQSLHALESFLWLQAHYATHRLAWLFHLGAGESLAALKQTERAAKEYQWVADHAPSPEQQVQGAFRIGDLYLERRQYDQALAAYYQALSRFPKEAQSYPVVNLNRGEAMFWLGEEAAAEKVFREFLEKNRAHPQGWRATYRLAEVLQRRQSGETKEVRQWYIDTVNRFPYSPGATLARIRLMVCGDHGGFTFESAGKFFNEEAAHFDPKGEVVSEHYGDLVAWNRVRAFHALGADTAALDAALTEIRLRPDSRRYAELADAFHSLLRSKVLELLAQGKKFDALKLYEDRYAKLPLKAREATGGETDYLLALSRAAADLGLPLVADQFGAKAALKLANNKERAPASGVPVVGSPDSESVSERAYGRAKSLWIAKGAAEGVKVRALLQDVADDSEYAYGRELMLGLIDEKEERLASALAHAAKAQLLLPQAKAKTSDEAAVVQHWIARLQFRAEENRTALESLRAVEKSGATEGSRGDALARTLGLPPIAPLSSILLDEGELQGRMNEWANAAETYARAFDAGGGNRALYEQSRAAQRAGDEAGSKLLLKRLAASDTEDFWKKLATEALANRETAGKFN